MRVLMLAPEPVYSPRGTPISIINRCRALTALGHQVDLVTYPLGQDVDMAGLRFIRTPTLPGLHQVRIGPSAAKLPLDALLLLVAARQLVVRRYDVIHTHEEAGVLGWLLKAIFRLPHLHDAHGDLTNILRNYGFGPRHPVVLLARWLDRRVLASASSVIAVFPELASAVTTQAPRTPVHLVHNVPLGQRMDPRLSDQLRSRWGKDRPVILYAGSLEPYQAIPLLLDAMALVHDKLPEARLVLAGGRQVQVTQMREHAAQLGIAEAVIFEGQRPSDEIPSYLAAADVLVSSRQDGPGTPLKIYAYMQAGKPIVATRTPSHLQVLNEQCAALADLTPAAMAEAITAVLRDPELSDRLSHAAAERARDFSVEEFLRRTAAAYRDLGAPTPSEQSLRTMVASLEEAI
jgi:glycosyltransferase involved in cell wall biosynthesis